MEIALQLLANGVALGGIYALVSMGLALVLGVMRIVNVAHGQLLVLGSIIAYLLFRHLGWAPYVSLAIGGLTLFVVGFVLSRFLVERVINAEHLVPLLLLFGVDLVLRGTLAATLGPQYFSVPSWQGGIDFFGVSLSRPRSYAFVLAALVAAALFVFLRWTQWGRAIRATAMSPSLASATGVNVRRARAVTFGVGAALAGIGGVLAVTSTAVSVLTSAETYLLIAFTATVLGGLGSLPGALVAGLFLGIVETTVAYVSDPVVARMSLYLVFVAVLVIRPAGLFGTRQEI